MVRRLLAPSIAAVLSAGVMVTGVAAPAPAVAVTAHYSETAYPQTKPSAGQFCKKKDRGVVTTAANGRKVRCTAEGSRSRWKYVK